MAKGDENPTDAPPSYEQVTGTSNSSSKPEPRNGISPTARRSMEDELRPLPSGWLRQYDSEYRHHFYVDTNKEPPRSIWHHPHDDAEYMNSLSSAEREHIKKQTLQVPAATQRMEESSEEEDEKSHAKRPGHSRGGSAASATAGASSSTAAAAAASSSSSASANPKSKKPFGERLKDKLTGTTHDERVKERARREKEEEESYRAHLAYRNAMVRAYETGQPQLVGRDKQGREVYVEPPSGPYGGGGSYGYGSRGYGPSSSYYSNPYTQGPYANPNARFIRPSDPYSRPMYGGYGGGLGLPLAGLTGGLLLGGLLL